jgi:hypothetical protein
MPITKKSPGYQVDQRVSIALDALDDAEKQAIGDILKDRAHFLASTADPRKVRRITEDHPLYALSVPAGLRLIYSRVGDEIVVMDLMHKANLAHERKSHAETERSETTKARRATRVEKAR